jgi:DNA polymerase-3 subunit gamma/tau
VGSGGLTLIDVRRLWPDIVEATKLRRRVAWMHLTQNSQVIGVEGNTLVLGFNNAGARDSFVNGGCDEILRQAAIDVVGMDWKVDAIVDPGARPDASSPSGSAPASSGGPTTASATAPVEAPPTVADAPAPPPEAPDDSAPEPTPPSARQAARPADPDAVAAARGAISRTRPNQSAEDPRASADADAHPDDPDADAGGVDTTELLQRELGAQVIEETRNQ